jgi:hypothetical protein
MIISGIIKDKNLFASTFSYIKDTFKSNRVVVFLLSLIGGVLPIEGRVVISAGLLDTVSTKDKDKKKFGIVDYLATHHYYLWSPLEKTVIIPMAAFGLTYLAWLQLIWPLLLVSILFIGIYIFVTVKDDELSIEHTTFKISDVIRNIIPFITTVTLYAFGYNMIICFGALTLYYMFLSQTWDIKKLFGYLKLDVIFTVVFVIVIGNFIKGNEGVIKSFITHNIVDTSNIFGFILLSILAFSASLAMGSSTKFVALAVLISSILGVEYFVWFYTIEYAAYLLSPTHKCVSIGNRYFGTPIKDYYLVLGSWSLLLILTGILFIP